MKPEIIQIYLLSQIIKACVVQSVNKYISINVMNYLNENKICTKALESKGNNCYSMSLLYSLCPLDEYCETTDKCHKTF